MSRQLLRVCLPLCLGMLILGCSSGEPPAGPADAVQTFYEHLNNGDYGKAMELYNAEARKVLADPDSASAGAFAEWAKEATKDGTIELVDVMNENEGEAGATVEYQVRYSDGTRSVHTVKLTFEDGSWKLGLIG